MIKKCVTCKKRYYDDFAECIFCFSQLEELRSEKNEILHFTQVNIPSVEHATTPYFCILSRDQDGNFLLSKSMEKPEKGYTVESSEKEKNYSIGVIGTGQMGRGITQVALQQGMKVILVSRTKERLLEAEREIKSFFLKFRTEKETEALLQSNLYLSADIKTLAKADVVIESVKEDLLVKKKLFSELNTICSPDTIIASNTASLSVAELAGLVTNPTRIAGLHFFYPVHKMELVEVIKAAKTSDETLTFLTKITEKLGKRPVLAKDNPGFIVNRILMPYLLEAVHLFEQGVTKEDIDQAAKLGLNHPMGPLSLIDFVGVDAFLYAVQNIYLSTGEEKFKVPSIIKRMVEEGKLGRKSGEGFYSYIKK